MNDLRNVWDTVSRSLSRLTELAGGGKEAEWLALQVRQQFETVLPSFERLQIKRVHLEEQIARLTDAVGDRDKQITQLESECSLKDAEIALLSQQLERLRLQLGRQQGAIDTARAIAKASVPIVRMPLSDFAALGEK